jgi:hypothetical protein
MWDVAEADHEQATLERGCKLTQDGHDDGSTDANVSNSVIERIRDLRRQMAHGGRQPEDQ